MKRKQLLVSLPLFFLAILKRMGNSSHKYTRQEAKPNDEAILNWSFLAWKFPNIQMRSPRKWYHFLHHGQFFEILMLNSLHCLISQIQFIHQASNFECIQTPLLVIIGGVMAIITQWALIYSSISALIVTNWLSSGENFLDGRANQTLVQMVLHFFGHPWIEFEQTTRTIVEQLETNWQLLFNNGHSLSVLYPIWVVSSLLNVFLFSFLMALKIRGFFNQKRTKILFHHVSSRGDDQQTTGFRVCSVEGTQQNKIIWCESDH